MGYSIAVPVRGEKLRQKMQAFMDEHYRDTVELFPKVYKYSDASKPTANLAYDDGKCRIGFNYNTSGSERQYIFALTRWMCLQVGRTKRLEIFHGSGIVEKVPYYVYEGNQACPIVLANEWKDKAPPRVGYPNEWEMHDEFGWLISNNREVSLIKRMYSAVTQRFLKEFETLHDEIKRLDALWKES